MSFSLHDAAAPVLTKALRNMIAWIEKAEAEGADEKTIVAAKLAEDMKPFTFQIQSASDSAKNAVMIQQVALFCNPSKTLSAASAA